MRAVAFPVWYAFFQSEGVFFLVCLKPSVMKPLYQFCNGQHMRNMWYICVAACAGFNFVRRFRHGVALDSWEGVGTLGHSRVGAWVHVQQPWVQGFQLCALLLGEDLLSVSR